MHGMREIHGPRRVTMTGGHRDPAASRTVAPERRPWSVMVLLSVAQFMVILDATVVNVALPPIARSLSLAPGGLQWVVTAYVLASGGLVLLGGRAADVAGRRRIFLAGLAVFTAASLASGLAPAAGALIAARAGQGLGAALLSPAALSILTASYVGTQRATALGVWGASAGAKRGRRKLRCAGEVLYLARLAVGVLGERARRDGGRPAERASGGPGRAAPRCGPRARPGRRDAGRDGSGDARLRAGGRARAWLGVGPDAATAGASSDLAGWVRHGRAVGAPAAGAGMG